MEQPRSRRLFALIARGILTADRSRPSLNWKKETHPKDVPAPDLTAYLGTIPDYVSGDIKGLKLSGVAADGPAAKAGVQGGDIVIKLAGKKIEDVYDYTYAIEALKIGEEIEMVVKRGDETISMKVTPTSRD